MWAQVDCSLAQIYSQYSMQDLLREFVDLRGIEKSFEHSAFHIVISSFHHIFFSLRRREYLVTQEEHFAFAQTKASNACNKKCRGNEQKILRWNKHE